MSQSTSASVKGPEGKGTREGIQRFGRFLSGMVMPNIGECPGRTYDHIPASTPYRLYRRKNGGRH
ncbi:MAG: hypothetical protein K0R93_3825 [Anaerosolibacter sp.]|uniref:hypothetical protein n=1 Tax=Anaerosolibacter sp. TaxID=1872527 RepID=UPI002A4B29F1|nr:hypothetical protein [Anaerosolibacter sp.]